MSLVITNLTPQQLCCTTSDREIASTDHHMLSFCHQPKLKNFLYPDKISSYPNIYNVQNSTLSLNCDKYKSQTDFTS